METQEFTQLIEHLKAHPLVPGSSEMQRQPRSGLTSITAAFENGRVLACELKDPQQITLLRGLFQENLKRVLAQASEYRDLLKLVNGQKYTLLRDGTMGFGVTAVQFTLEAIEVGRFAQYDHCIDLIIRAKRSRSLGRVKFYGREDFAIFSGWIEIDTNPFGPAEDQGVMIVRSMKYPSCDSRFMTDAIVSAKVAPIYVKRFGATP